MSAASFIEKFLDAQEWEDDMGSSPWSGQGNAVGRAWPYGKPETAEPETPAEIIRRQALEIGRLTEELQAYQTGRTYEIGYEHGRLAALKSVGRPVPTPEPAEERFAVGDLVIKSRQYAGRILRKAAGVGHDLWFVQTRGTLEVWSEKDMVKA